MGTKSLTRPAAAKLYDQDFVAWASETARLLRLGRLEELDIENLAQEIHGMGDSSRHELRSRLRVLTMHLLKWGWQPGKRSGSWKATIVVQRDEIDDLLTRSPSLRPAVREFITTVYAVAVEEAAAETGLAENFFPRDCPFSVEQILKRGFYPER